MVAQCKIMAAQEEKIKKLEEAKESSNPEPSRRREVPAPAGQNPYPEPVSFHYVPTALSRPCVEVMSASDFNTLYSSTTGDSISISSSSDLYIYLNKPGHVNLVTQVNLRIPSVNWFCITHVPKSSPELQNFLLKYAPDKVNAFDFGLWADSQPISYYLPYVLTLSPCVKQKLWLRNFTISQSEFARILFAFKEIQKIAFDRCKIEKIGSELGNFGDFTVKTLQLSKFTR